MKNEITKTVTIADFVSALNRGEESIREAANILCRMVDSDPKTYEKIYKETGISMNVLGNLERVGRGAMHYKLLFDTSPEAKYIASLPASHQNDVYENGVKVVTVVDGRANVKIKSAQWLSVHESKVAFDKTHVRTVEEQIKVASQTAPKAIARTAQRYTFENDKLIVFSNTVFTMSQLEDIMEKMKTAAIKSLATKK